MALLETKLELLDGKMVEILERPILSPLDVDTQFRRVQDNMDYLFDQQRESEANTSKLATTTETLEKDVEKNFKEVTNKMESIIKTNSDILEQSKSMNSIPWFRDSDMGESTMLGYSLMDEINGKDKEKKKPSKKA